MRLTDITIRALKPPERGQRDYWDDALSGFGLRVSQGGTKTFILLQNGNRRSLGRFPQISLAQARGDARKRLAHFELGHTLSAANFCDALDEYIEQHVHKNNKPSSAYEAERVLRRHFTFGNKSLDDIQARDIMRVIDALLPSAANHAFTQARAFFRWCMRRRYLSRNPLEHLVLPNKAVSRDRVLTDNELRLIWHAAQLFPFPFGIIVSLLILTGQRLGEVSTLRWEYIDLDQRIVTLPAAIVKNNTQHVFPLSDMASDLIKTIENSGGYLFPAKSGGGCYSGYNKSKGRFEEACNAALAKELKDDSAALKHWTLHDLRRTFSTIHARIGTPPHVTEALLNHKTGTRSPIQRIYDRHTYLPEMRAAIANYEMHLTKILEPRASSASEITPVR